MPSNLTSQSYVPQRFHPLIIQLLDAGCWGEAEGREALELCMGACMQLRETMREVLVQAAESAGQP